MNVYETVTARILDQLEAGQAGGDHVPVEMGGGGHVHAATSHGFPSRGELLIDRVHRLNHGQSEIQGVPDSSGDLRYRRLQTEPSADPD